MFVDFFFVLREFVLARAYRSRLSSGEGISEFTLRRLGRLYPLHVVSTLVWRGYPLARVGASHSSGHALDHSSFGPSMTLYSLVTNLRLVYSPGLHQALTWTFPSWSISTEF
jgi:peptidoglycan/LPS O-acetylase OafA/YrhL